MNDSVEGSIRDFVVGNFLFGDTGQTLGREDSFLEAGILDSTGVIELVVFLEESFNIAVANDELVPRNLDSVHRLVDFVQSKLGVNESRVKE